MFRNHLGKTVRQWDGAEESICPECRRSLIARRGEIKVWHWAHKAVSGGLRIGCPFQESEWHLAMKHVYEAFPGWEIEVPTRLENGKLFYLDAVNPKTGQVREFVHSLSSYYVTKHLLLQNLVGFHVSWVMDGSVFVSARRRRVAHGGYCRFLKPRAEILRKALGVKSLLVHWEGDFWGEWQEDVWYPKRGPRARSVLAAFSQMGA